MKRILVDAKDLFTIDQRTTSEVESSRCFRKFGAERCVCGKPQSGQCVLSSIYARNVRVKRLRPE